MCVGGQWPTCADRLVGKAPLQGNTEHDTSVCKSCRGRRRPTHEHQLCNARRCQQEESTLLPRTGEAALGLSNDRRGNLQTGRTGADVSAAGQLSLGGQRDALSSARGAGRRHPGCASTGAPCWSHGHTARPATYTRPTLQASARRAIAHKTSRRPSSIVCCRSALHPMAAPPPAARPAPARPRLTPGLSQRRAAAQDPLVTVTKVDETPDQLLDQNAGFNANADWVNYKGASCSLLCASRLLTPHYPNRCMGHSRGAPCPGQDDPRCVAGNDARPELDTALRRVCRGTCHLSLLRMPARPPFPGAGGCTLHTSLTCAGVLHYVPLRDGHAF